MAWLGDKGDKGDIWLAANVYLNHFTVCCHPITCKSFCHIVMNMVLNTKEVFL